MAKPDLKVLNLLCPDRRCGAAMVQDECGIFCRACGYEAITWADPVDADVPMNILVAREEAEARRKVVWRGGLAIAAALLIALAAWTWWPKSPTEIGARDISTISVAEMQQAFATNRHPEGLILPAYYGDPELFLLKRERSSQSDLVIWWNQLSSDEKLLLLDQAKDLQSIFVLPYLFEISYFTAAQEQDFKIARSLLGALYGCSDDHLDVVRFVCDHLANATPIPEVRNHATRFVADLDERRRRLGR